MIARCPGLPQLAGVALLLLAACVSAPADRARQVDRLATEAGLALRHYRSGPFTLTGWLRAGSSGPLLVVIEGDGFAWASKSRPSSDPTPANPAGLHLALGQETPRLLALARPCQYGGVGTDAACDPRYWTSHRFAPEAVAAMGGAIDAAKRETGADRVALAGFSGGGTMAALLAAARADVVALTTVASPLDLSSWSDLHQVSPLTGSLDPAALAGRWRTLPQRHYVGADDAVVPPAWAADVAARLGLPAPIVLPGRRHGDTAGVRIDVPSPIRP